VKVGILGTGPMGRTIAAAVLALGHQVKLGTWASCAARSAGTVDPGGIEGARLLEPPCVPWVTPGFRTNTWEHALKLLRK